MPVTSENTSHLLRDIRAYPIHRELRPVYRLREKYTRQSSRRDVSWDFELGQGRENLAQAIIMRLLVPRGELSALGHPQYGSRVHELIGGRNTASQRNLLKLHILEALEQEPRVKKVAELDVQASKGTRSTVDVLLRVEVAGLPESLQIGPFSIDLGASS